MRRIAFTLAATLAWAVTATAQPAPQSPPQPGALRLTLEEATTRAVEQSHRLAEARAKRAASAR